MNADKAPNAADRGSALSEGLGAGAGARRFARTYCSQCGGEFGPGEAGYSRCNDHTPGRNSMKTTTPPTYAAHAQPTAERVRDLKFGGAWFEVHIDCLEPDEPGVVTHPDNYWIEGVKLGGVWWGAEDVLSDYMRQCLNEALRAMISDEDREEARTV